jgi:4-amino-4-deoxy-L-arabinose transferase-like glycosyltransferase
MATHALPTGKQGPISVRAFAERNWVVPAVFGLAFALRALLLLLLPQAPYSDGAFYFGRALGLVSGEGYSENGIPTAYWPIGYPAMLAGSMLVFGKSLLGPMLLNLASAMALLWLVLTLGRRLGGELAGRTAALLYALYPAHIAYTGAVMSETSYTAVTMGGFCLLVAARRDWRGLLLAGLLFGLATLMRPQTMLFPLGAIVALLAVCRDFRWRDAARAALIVHLALFATVLPWSLRNQRVMSEFVLVSTNGGSSLLTGANDGATGDHYEWEDGPLWAASGIPHDQKILRQVELDHRFGAMARDWIRQHPGRYLALGPKKLALLWSKDSDGFWMLQNAYPDRAGALRVAQWLNQLYFMALLAFAAFAFWRAARAVLGGGQGEERGLGLLLCMPLFVSLLGFFFTGQVRYHYPAMPFVIVAAGWTIAFWLNRRLPSGLRHTN